MVTGMGQVWPDADYWQINFSVVAEHRPRAGLAGRALAL
jgi:hypothetical protein